MANKDGAKVVIVNVTALLTPFGVVTSTALGPNTAAGSTLKVAEICEGDTDILLMVIPTMGVITAPARFDPLMITGKAAPAGALGGLMPINTGPVGGDGKLVSNERLLLCPADVNTLNVQRLSGELETENNARI